MTTNFLFVAQILLPVTPPPPPRIPTMNAEQAKIQKDNENGAQTNERDTFDIQIMISIQSMLVWGKGGQLD